MSRLKRFFSILTSIIIIMNTVSIPVEAVYTDKIPVLENNINFLDNLVFPFENLDPNHYENLVKSIKDENKKTRQISLNEKLMNVQKLKLETLISVTDSLRSSLKDLNVEFTSQLDSDLQGLRRISENTDKTEKELVEVILKNENESYAKLLNTVLLYNTTMISYNYFTGLLTDSINPGNLVYKKDEIQPADLKSYTSYIKDITKSNKELKQNQKKMEEIFLESSRLIKSGTGIELASPMEPRTIGTTSYLMKINSYALNFAEYMKLYTDLTQKTGGGEVKPEQSVQNSNGSTNNPQTGEKPNERAFSPEETNRFVINHYEDYKARLDIQKNLANLLSKMANNTKQKGLKTKKLKAKSQELDTLVTQNTEIIDKLKKSSAGFADDSLNDSSFNGEAKVDNLPESYLNLMPELFDTSKKQVSQEYQGLFSWTANFTPFVTNIYDSDIKGRLNEKEKKVFDKYSNKRNIVYMAVAEQGIAKGIRSGTPYQYKPISLAEFIDKADNELVLFTKAISDKSEVRVQIPAELPRPSTLIEATAGNAPQVTESTGGQGVVENIVATSNSSSNSISQNITVPTALPWKLINGSLQGSNNSKEPAQFIGPIYASSGINFKEPWSLDDMGNANIKNLISKTNPMKEDNIIDEDKLDELQKQMEQLNIDEEASRLIKEEEAILNKESTQQNNSQQPKEVKKIEHQQGQANREKKHRNFEEEKPFLNEITTSQLDKSLSNVETIWEDASFSMYGAWEGEKIGCNSNTLEKGDVALTEAIWTPNLPKSKYFGRYVFLEGIGYARIADKMGKKSRTIDMWFETEEEGKKFFDESVRRHVYLMKEGFIPEKLFDPNITAPKSLVNLQEQASIPVKEEKRIEEEVVQGIKEKIFEGVDEVKVRDNSIAKFLGNNMNMNYFLLHNNLATKRQNSASLEEDLNKPLYSDFLGNILTQSGFIVIPAASNYNYYNSPMDLPMFNAAFINSYPDLRFNENNYVETSKSDKDKFVYMKNKQGYVTVSRLNSEGRKKTSKFYALPFSSTVRYNDYEKPIQFMDDVTSFKSNVSSFAKSKNPNDESHNLVYVKNGPVIEKSTVRSISTVNLKSISGNGYSLDWELIKNINKKFINVKEKGILNQELLIANAVTSELSKDDVNVVVTDYVSKDSELKTKNSLVKVIGEIYESLTMRAFSLLDINYTLFTPSSENMPFAPNAGINNQRIMLIVSLLFFLFYIFRFVWSVFTRNDFEIRSTMVTMVIIAVIGATSIFLTPKIIYFLYNKPVEIILKNNIPIFVLDSIEQEYVGESPYFFDTTGSEEINSNPSINLAKLNKKDIDYIRKEVTQTPITASQFYTSTLDNSRINIIGDKVYLQGKYLKIDIPDLFEVFTVDDVLSSESTTKMEFNYSGYGEIANYMPFIQIGESLTDTINRYNEQISNPYKILRYRKGLNKTGGRTSEFIKSILFMAPDFLDSFKDDKVLQYLYNIDTMGDYYNDITMPEEVRKLKDAIESLNIPDENSEGVSFDDIRVKATEKEIDDAYRDVTLLQEVSNYIASNSNSEYYWDWLGLSKVLLLEPDSNLFPEPYSENIVNARWYPKKSGTKPDDVWRKEIEDRMFKVNENTKRFVIDKIIPISQNISDDTLIKIISLYATMEYNKEFQDIVETKIFPKYYNVERISNYIISKSLSIPNDEIFVSGVNKLAKYIAKETGIPGLLMSLIITVTSFVRMNIRIFMLSIVILLVSYMLLYIYAAKRNKYSKFINGVIISVLVFAILYWVELLLFVAQTYVAKSSPMGALTLALIPNMLLTIIYFRLVIDIMTDIGNFGYGNYERNVMSAMARVTGIDLSEAYQNIDTSEFIYDNNSEMSHSILSNDIILNEEMRIDYDEDLILGLDEDITDKNDYIEPTITKKAPININSITLDNEKLPENKLLDLELDTETTTVENKEIKISKKDINDILKDLEEDREVDFFK